MPKFKIGDRVKTIKQPSLREEQGVVVRVAEGGKIIGVRFDTAKSGRHSCGGLCEWGHGKQVWDSNLELAPMENV